MPGPCKVCNGAQYTLIPETDIYGETTWGPERCESCDGTGTENDGKTLKLQGNQYIIVKDWAVDEKLGYRELRNGFIEVMSMYCGVIELSKVHVGFLKMVLEHRERTGEKACEKSSESLWMK